jgi:hypothetical protein
MIPYRTAGLDRLGQMAYQHGLGYLWRNFESKIPVLFVDDATENRIGVVKADRDQLHWVSTLEDLCSTLREGMSKLLYEPLHCQNNCFMVNEDFVRILDRYNSWSRIDITIQAFSVICHFAEITPFFLHFLVGMGRKFSSKDEDFMSCYSSFASENTSLVSSLDSGMEKQNDPLWGESGENHPSGNFLLMV